MPLFIRRFQTWNYRLFITACTTVIFRQPKFHPKFLGVKFTSHTISCLKLRRLA